MNNSGFRASWNRALRQVRKGYGDGLSKDYIKKWKKEYYIRPPVNNFRHSRVEGIFRLASRKDTAKSIAYRLNRSLSEQHHAIKKSFDKLILRKKKRNKWCRRSNLWQEKRIKGRDKKQRDENKPKNSLGTKKAHSLIVAISECLANPSILLVGRIGIEPITYWLRVSPSPNL